MMAVELRASFVKIRSATKIQILSFYPALVRYSQEEESRPLEKTALPSRFGSLTQRNS
jgi:hypothetical protein